MFHFYYCHLPELQTMRSVSGDYSLQAAIHHNYALVFRLPARLFSATKRAKSCIHISPRAIENSVSVLSTSNPSTRATKNPWVEAVVPVEPDAVSDACAVPTGKDKSQPLVIPIRITVSGRWGSRLSALLKSVGKYTPPAPSHLENSPLPFKRMSLATGLSSDVDGSSICPTEFTRGKGCPEPALSSGLSDPLRHNDHPPEYTAVMPESRAPEGGQGTPGKDAVAARGKAALPFPKKNSKVDLDGRLARHHVSLDTNPAVAGTCEAIPENCVGRKKNEGFPSGGADEHATCVTGETGLDLGVVPGPALTLASSSAPTLGPTHEVKVSRQPVVESNFLHFYSTLKPYIVQRELPSRFVKRIPRPIDNGALPESDGFRVLEGPFTCPAGGTSTPGVQEPPFKFPPLPTNCGALREKESGIKHANPCLAPVIAASTDSTSHQLVSRSIVPARLSDEVLRKAMTWDLDILHARTGFAQPLNSALRSMQNKWEILKFDLAFEIGGASMFRDSYGFAAKPLELQPPCLSPRITELDDEDGPVSHKAAGEIRSYGGEASGSGGVQARQGSGSSAHFKKPGSTRLPRSRKRPSDDDDGDGRGRKRERREEPPVGNDPPPPDSEGEGVPCPYWVRDRQNCKKKSCMRRKKNLSKLKCVPYHPDVVISLIPKAVFADLHKLAQGTSSEGTFPTPWLPFRELFHAGDKFQINRHQKTAHPGQVEMEPILRTTDPSLSRKNQALATRNLTWEQICDICFREEPEDLVTEPIVGTDGGYGLGSEGEEEEEVEEFYDEEGDGEDYEDQEDRDDQEDQEDREGREDQGDQADRGDHSGHEAREEYVKYQGGRASNYRAFDVEEGRRGDFIPPSPFGADQSILSNGAPTIPDTPEPLLADSEELPFDPSEFHWPELPASPAPDRNNFHGQPPLSSLADKVSWEVAEDHISSRIEDFRRACFEGLRNRHGASPRTAQQMGHVLQDIDRFFRDIGHSANVALNLPDGGSGPVAYCARDSCSYPVRPTGQGSIPLDLSVPQALFQDPTGFPLGGDSSTPPSLTHDSRSSHGSALRSVFPPAFFADGVPFPGLQPAMASGSQPGTSGMAGPEAGGNAIHDPLGHVLAHGVPGGGWSVGGVPLGTQPGFGPSHF
ncbi:unnamed protein product [Tuber aestivum]|uniref:Uncharacterized protein n=1 Tax=Tuber aestivum TaxID=59557 RepID=A0A292Q0B8_9PEZI|nr:unnamed protein product [Tuber aestivum]